VDSASWEGRPPVDGPGASAAQMVPSVREGLGDFRFKRKPRSLTRDAVDRLLRSPSGVIGLFMLGLLILIALTADWISPYGPLAVNPPDAFNGPSAQHLFGTDEFGRDIFSRVLFGARISLQVGFVATLVSVSFGIVLGMISGYAGGVVDSLIMRFADIMLAIPSQLLALAIVSALGPSIRNVMLAVGISAVPRFSRLVRGTVLSAKQNVYVEAARTIGCRGSRVVFRHIFPNVIGPAVVLATLYVSSAILLAAGLSFLGMGAQPPTPEWGSMLSKGRYYLRSAPWVTTFPGLAIMFTVLAVNLFGDALRDAMDPRMTR
jgi:peptide/nickel transport system permease protein